MPLGPSLRELKAAPTAETLRRHAPAIALTALVFGALGVLGLRAVARRGRWLDAALWLGFAADPPRLARAMDQKLEGTRGAWVVLSRAEDLDPGGAFASFMSRRFPGAQAFALEGVRVWHVTVAGN